jgi:hypothetical protein
VKCPQRALPILAVILAAGIGGYWLGHNGLGTSEILTSIGAAQTNRQAPSGPVIYYRDPDGGPFYSLEPKQTADGRPYRAVLASDDISFDFLRHHPTRCRADLHLGWPTSPQRSLNRDFCLAPQERG